MNETQNRRWSALGGLAAAAAVALWWLGSTRLALDSGADAGRSSAETLQAAWLLRGVALPVLALRVGALRGWRASAAAALGFNAPSWPVVVLAWSASASPLSRLAWAEGLLLAAALLLPLLGHGLRRALRGRAVTEPVATTVGIALAASVWLTRGAWTLPQG